ncbi:MAG TPA: serine/threonine-protein kinase [Kofleriaceae bacterium]|nr:serine/threonine-protein kinase [Kofleriaceae bacterium]
MVASSDPYIGKVIDGRYEIQQRVGEGGMGVVYKARQMSIDRIIALKMLNQQMQGDQTWVQRFYNEAKACSRLQHPNTIRMFDFGQTQDGRLFMTMEFLDGVSLRDALQRGPIAPQRVVKILIQCCASLAEAHSIGIIHRDIKPDNVFLLNMAGSPDFVKLLDFSDAKLLEGDRMKTQAGVVFGTPQYMSPEQGRGLPLDARSDLYALGVLAFEMLTGNVPYNDDNAMTVIQMHLHAAVPPMPDSVPYSVQAIVRRAMEKDPARRYQSAGEMMQHAQQVFAELNAGGVSVGGGGVPRTVIASNPQQLMGQPAPGGMPPGMQPPGMQPGQLPYGGPPQMSGLAPPQGGYAASAPQAKTMIAQSPFQGGVPGGPMPGQMPGQGPMPGQPGPMPGQPPGGGFQPSSPMQKTIVAGMAPPIVGGQMMPQGTPQQGFPQPGPPPGFPPGPPGGAPNKTVMLQPSEGVVSVARAGGAVPAAGGMAAGTSVQQGASTLYWIVCLVMGIAVGVLGYVIVLHI